MANTAVTKTFYDASKLKNALDFEFMSMDVSIKKTGRYFLEDMKKN